tara:strand:- start:44 stop:412 length:369 start_codon:yes stop_codon:yes gene_type:complete
MRRSASEVIRNLEQRIARLENKTSTRKAGIAISNGLSTANDEVTKAIKIVLGDDSPALESVHVTMDWNRGRVKITVLFKTSSLGYRFNDDDLKQLKYMINGSVMVLTQDTQYKSIIELRGRG